MKVPVYNKDGKKIEDITLPKELFGVSINSDLVHQVAVIQMSNRRQGTAHAKDRGEVSGGGRKPWAQKGTGRARHGSTRSPIWVGGGVTFGPTKNRNFKKSVSKKIRRKALLMVLSAKAKEKLLIVLDKFDLEKIKTKEFNNILNNLPCEKKNCLFVLPEATKELVLSARNIDGIETMEARNLNPLDLLSFKYLIISKDSINIIKDTFLK
jgi:large subunit ribosomal protein L4